MTSYRDAEGREFNAVLLDGPTMITGPNGETCVPAGWYLIEPMPMDGLESRPVGVTPETFKQLAKVKA